MADIVLRLDGDTIGGDLHITGAGHPDTAVRVAFALADGLRAAYPEMHVSATIEEGDR